MRRAVLLLALAPTLAATEAAAQTVPFECGPNCAVPGEYVLCRDNFDNDMSTAGGIALETSLERACISFEPPTTDFTINGFVALFGPGSIFFSLVEVFKERGGEFPGPKLREQGAQVPADSQNGFSGLYFNTATATVAFRLCLTQQLDSSGPRPLLYDADGAAAPNRTFALGQGWNDFSSGDFILRAVVRYDELGPWEAGGACDTGNMDAGTPDTGPPVDGGPGMDASPPADAGDGGGTPADTGAPPVDGGGADGGPGPDPDGGGTGGDPPTIDAISPDEGLTSIPVDVTITGTNFRAGLDLMIGSIQANDVTVPGTTTILGTVPSGISPGTYDVLVRNPDGQTAILPDGYTVLPDGGSGSPPDEGCGCHATRRGATSASVLFLAALLLLRRRPTGQ